MANEDRFKAHVGLTFPAGSLERFKEYAQSQGKSLSVLICELLDKKMEQDGFVYTEEEKE